MPESGRGRVVRNRDIVQFYHANTDSYLLTHDVASPMTTTKQEFTTWPKADIDARYNDTEFQVLVIDGHDGEPWKTKSGWFQLMHMQTKVKLWTGATPLPDWGFKQQEVNGDKAPIHERSVTWYADEIILDDGEPFKSLSICLALPRSIDRLLIVEASPSQTSSTSRTGRPWSSPRRPST